MKSGKTRDENSTITVTKKRGRERKEEGEEDWKENREEQRLRDKMKWMNEALKKKKGKGNKVRE